jgi:DNA-binding NarL/FixJ family response regulator
MEKSKRVVLFGDTLVLAGVRSSLEAEAAINVVTLEPMHDVDQALRELEPDIIIFDTGSVHFQLFGTLIHEHTQLLLIGIDPDDNQVRVWMGQQLDGLSVNELTGIINKYSNIELSVPVNTPHFIS